MCTLTIEDDEPLPSLEEREQLLKDDGWLIVSLEDLRKNINSPEKIGYTPPMHDPFAFRTTVNNLKYFPHGYTAIDTTMGADQAQSVMQKVRSDRTLVIEELFDEWLDERSAYD